MPTRRRFFRNFAVAPLVAAGAGAKAQPAVPFAPGPPPWPDDSDPQFWDRLREQFYLKPGEAYFNTGTIGATPRPVLERVIEDMRTLQATLTRWDWSPFMPNWISGYSPEVPLRQKLAKLVNADAMEIGLIQNATMGMNFLSHGLDLKSGDEVITTNQEHPGGVCGWQLRAKRDGVVWKQIQMPVPANDPDELVRLYAQAITPRTRVLSFPHIISPTAVVMPVKRLSALAHDHKCLAVVDGAHGVGQVEVDMKDIGCDAYFASPHKWLLAPPGNGMLYIPRERQDQFWTTLDSSEWDNHKDGMYRFMQYGTGNMSLLAGLDAAIDFHYRIGPGKVRARIRSLADRLRNGLQQIPSARISSPVHPELAGAIVVHRIEGVPAQKLQDELWLRGQLRVRSVGDALGVRQSCMIYNSEAEIDATLEIVKALAAKLA